MGSNKHNCFRLIYEFISICSRQIQENYLCNKIKDSIVNTKISGIQKFFQCHLESGQQLIHTDSYQDASYS